MKVLVEVYDEDGDRIRRYEMDHDDPAQRRVLGIQCRNAFEGGQSIHTSPVIKCPDLPFFPIGE